MRKVLIEKIGETTIVRTWEELSPDVKNNYAYNKGADYSQFHILVLPTNHLIYQSKEYLHYQNILEIVTFLLDFPTLLNKRLLLDDNYLFDFLFLILFG